MGKELSLNILEIARKVQKLAESYPASKVIMTGGGNVEDAVDEIDGRVDTLVKVTTVTGSTNANGVMATNIAGNKKIVDIKVGSYMVMPFVRPGAGGEGTIEIVLFDYGSDLVLKAQPNKTVTATVYYID